MYYFFLQDEKNSAKIGKMLIFKDHMDEVEKEKECWKQCHDIQSSQILNTKQKETMLQKARFSLSSEENWR